MNERALIKIAKLEERVNVLEGMVGLSECKVSCEDCVYQGMAFKLSSDNYFRRDICCKPGERQKIKIIKNKNNDCADFQPERRK